MFTLQEAKSLADGLIHICVTVIYPRDVRMKSHSPERFNDVKYIFFIQKHLSAFNIEIMSVSTRCSGLGIVL
jgi:hypothetical protein